MRELCDSPRSDHETAGRQEVEHTAADDGVAIRPKHASIRRPDDPLTPEESDLRDRLQAQVLQRPDDQWPARTLNAASIPDQGLRHVRWFFGDYYRNPEMR
ncbi:hypothetical protein [Nocardia sp. NBC_00403]|uniref:hypothetical protein n=1 Tax=Nocardia sp. NBC_00403 TaxID=2975990 RepID=UPI002E225224